MGIQDKPFTPDIQAAYVLATVMLLDALYPDTNIMELVTKIAEGIYEEVIAPSGLAGTEENPATSGGGSENPADTDGPTEND
jgi:hypothetical protein